MKLIMHATEYKSTYAEHSNPIKLVFYIYIYIYVCMYITSCLLSPKHQ